MGADQPGEGQQLTTYDGGVWESSKERLLFFLFCVAEVRQCARGSTIPTNCF